LDCIFISIPDAHETVGFEEGVLSHLIGENWEGFLISLKLKLKRSIHGSISKAWEKSNCTDLIRDPAFVMVNEKEPGISPGSIAVMSNLCN